MSFRVSGRVKNLRYGFMVSVRVKNVWLYAWVRALQSVFVCQGTC